MAKPDGTKAETGGEGGIRTPGGLAPPTVFKTVAIDHSATSPFGRFKTSLATAHLAFLRAVASPCPKKSTPQAFKPTGTIFAGCYLIWRKSFSQKSSTFAGCAFRGDRESGRSRSVPNDPVPCLNDQTHRSKGQPLLRWHGAGGCKAHQRGHEWHHLFQ
jgi:hypothetical protein